MSMTDLSERRSASRTPRPTSPMGPAPMTKNGLLRRSAPRGSPRGTRWPTFQPAPIARSSIVARQVQLAGRHRVERLQPAVAMHAQRLVALATVGVPALAGITLLAIEVRLHGAAIPHLHPRHALHPPRPLPRPVRARGFAGRRRTASCPGTRCSRFRRCRPDGPARRAIPRRGRRRFGDYR
jgi:hypothetical protein